jgi:hypothetical protein
MRCLSDIQNAESSPYTGTGGENIAIGPNLILCQDDIVVLIVKLFDQYRCWALFGDGLGIPIHLVSLA